MSQQGFDAHAIAQEVLGAISSGRQTAPFSERAGGLDLRGAYAVAAALRRERERKGDRAIGRKIGFTNRTLWSQYGVFAPIWGDMYASSVHEAASFPDGFPISGLMEPRIEPEIAFKLAAPPDPAMDDAALLACIAWVAHGFEIVQSLFPGWRFAAADCVAGGGLHAALLLGTPQPIAGRPAGEWLEGLNSFEIELLCDGKRVDRGSAVNVLDGPLPALRHLIGLLRDDGDNPPLAAGEIVTTGTVTGAFLIAPGERWSTRIAGLPLEGLDIAFH